MSTVKRVLMALFLFASPIVFIGWCTTRNAWYERPEYLAGLQGYGANGIAFASLGFILITLPLLPLAALYYVAVHVALAVTVIRTALAGRGRAAMRWLAWLLIVVGSQIVFAFVIPDWGKPEGYDPNPNMYGYKIRKAPRVDAAAIRRWMESADFQAVAAEPHFYPPKEPWLEKLRREKYEPWCELHPPGVKIHLGNGFEQTLGVFVGPGDLKQYPEEKYVATLKLKDGVWLFDQGYP